MNVTVRVAITASFCFIGRLRDVSASGAFLVTPTPVPDFGTLRIWLRTPVRGNIESALAGGVVRSAPDGVGIEWLEFAPPCISHLTQYYLTKSVPPRGQLLTVSRRPAR